MFHKKLLSFCSIVMISSASALYSSEELTQDLSDSEKMAFVNAWLATPEGKETREILSPQYIRLLTIKDGQDLLQKFADQQQQDRDREQRRREFEASLIKR